MIMMMMMMMMMMMKESIALSAISTENVTP